MAAFENALIDFFVGVAHQEPELIAKLKQKSFEIEQERWIFTLPDLHRFLQQHNETFKTISYVQFRSIVFGSAINQSIQKYGAEVIIADNQGKVDKSEYALVWGKKPNK